MTVVALVACHGRMNIGGRRDCEFGKAGIQDRSAGTAKFGNEIWLSRICLSGS
ncbi:MULTISPECIES: hypothetical protein [unclassified Bradyrhizobium]|uniref:hypothetical protein n=1 Tax=unclassified Bradyrhizobium TaxID=2631580 RepID=UPI0028ECB0C4|nr:MULTISPECIES: hypothetical protein [unclassified Bradyrhizobium]